jgi:RNA polymerase sigma factor (sigma-70 family)
MQDPTDASIVARSLRYPSAFATVFDRHWPDLHAYCTRRAGTAGEDIAAEVFRVAFDDRRRSDGRTSSARPWLFGIATNLLRSHFRGTARGRRAFARSIPVDTSDPTGDALSRIEAEQLGPNLAAAIGDLPAKDRDALLLLAWTDLRYEDIAQAPDIPIGTVRSRISRARTRVRAHLTAQEDNP